MLGVLAGAEEGAEIDVLGLTFGVDLEPLSVKLPIAGRVLGCTASRIDARRVKENPAAADNWA